MDEPTHPSTTAPEPIAHRWRNIVLVSFANVVDGAEGGILGVLFPLIRSAFGLGVDALGVISAVVKLVGAVFGPLWGMLGDRANRKNILVFAAGLWGLWTVAIGASQSYAQLVTLSIIAAIGSAASVPVINSITADLFPDSERGKAAGVVAGLVGLVGILFIVAAGQLANIDDGWRLGYYIFGGLSVLSGVLILLFFKEPERGASDAHLSDVAHQAAEAFGFKASDVPRLFSVRSLALMLADKFFIGTVTLFTFLPTFLVDHRGFELEVATLVVGALAAGLGVGRFVAGSLSDRMASHGILSRARLYHVSIGLSIVLLAVSLGIDFGANLAIYALLNLLLGFVLAFDNPVMHPMIANVTVPELRSSAYGLWQSGTERLGDVVFTLIVGGLAASVGLDTTLLYLVTGLVIFRFAIWFLMYRFYPSDVADTDAELTRRHEALVT